MAIINVDLQKTIEDSFVTYAGYVIQSRSVPDVRDCLKYSARQLLYAQYVDKIVSSKPFKKAQRSISAAMANFYVHGDASCYGTYIRMAKPFAMRYPLEEAQGNYGTPINPEDHSAPRYVELRAASLADELFASLEKGTIDEWKDNYDQTDKFPVVFPSIGYYNIVNGCSGIAVGMSTSIPQFNIRDVNNALILLLNNPDATFEQLYCPIDFATGGIIINEDEVKESLRSGHGKSARIRAKIEYDVKKHQLIVTEMPYSVYTNTVCAQLQELLEKEPNTGIEKFIDATGEKPCIKITLTKKANPESVKQWLYSNTSLQNYYSINMIMLEGGRTPRLFGWVDALKSHLEHVKEVKRAELQADLDKAVARLEIVNGYLIALANIEEVIDIIKRAENAAQAALNLMAKFGFTERQAKAILDLKLQRLVNMEYIKIEKERDNLKATIDHLNNILNTVELFNKEIEKELKRVIDKYADPHRTVNIMLVKDDDEKPIETKNLVVTVSNNGLIQAMEADKFIAQTRGGKGSTIKLENSDYIIETIYGVNEDSILLLSNIGKAYSLKLGSLPIGDGVYLQTLLEMGVTERITHVIPYNKIDQYKYVIIATKNGMIKKTSIEEYKGKRKAGLVGIKLKDDSDAVAAVGLIQNEDDELFIVTKESACLRIKQEDVNATGRATMGVKAIKLDANDSIIGMEVLSQNRKYLGLASVSKNGIAKCTPIDEFSISSRYTKGTTLQNLREGDTQAAIKLILDNKSDIFVIASNAIIRIPLGELKISGRNTIGTTTMKLRESQQILKLAQAEE